MLGHLFLTLAALDDIHPAWWTVVGGIVYAICATINKGIDSAKFRGDMQREIGALQAKDREQQTLLDRQRNQIEKLQRAVLDRDLDLDVQRKLKHNLRGKLHTAYLALELYRTTFNQLPEDKLDLKAIEDFSDVVQE